MNIYVGNLPYHITEEGLNAMFAEFGAVDSAKIVMDRTTGRSKGFGFVEMSESRAADQAIRALNGKNVEGRAIKVNQAKTGGKRVPRPMHQRRYSP